ncbi:hypothetical protein PATSB16_32130 [Pandoraea thiooxydans]|nr:hypothetical protein PATSB16_32130 [Pandoraea thiooxydans]
MPIGVTGIGHCPEFDHPKRFSMKPGALLHKKNRCAKQYPNR